MLTGCTQDEPEVVIQARETLVLLQTHVERPLEASTTDSNAADLIKRVEDILPSLVDVIQATTDEARMQDLPLAPAS